MIYGLLRKYKISKISDTICLSEKELKICQILNKLINLTIYKLPNKGSTFFIDNDGKCVMEYTILNNLYINYVFCWEHLEELNIEYSDIQYLIQIWVEDGYKLNIKTVNYPIGLISKLAEDFYKLHNSK